MLTPICNTSSKGWAQRNDEGASRDCWTSEIQIARPHRTKQNMNTKQSFYLFRELRDETTQGSGPSFFRSRLGEDTRDKSQGRVGELALTKYNYAVYRFLKLDLLLIQREILVRNARIHFATTDVNNKMLYLPLSRGELNDLRNFYSAQVSVRLL